MSMKTSIKGKAIIPKEVWTAKAEVYLDVATDLMVLFRIGVIERESDAAKALSELIGKYLAAADDANKRMAATKRGRPKLIKPAPAPNLLAALLMGVPYKKKAKPGRPVTWGPRMNLLTYRLVESVRADLKRLNKTATIKAAIDAINERVAQETGYRVAKYVQAAHASTRASYRRGKLLSGA